MLGDIYTQYKELLREQGIAYEGMLYREVTETMDVQQFPYDKYVFVGFNVLNKVEQTLFSKLHEAGKALFYWDYDTFYLNKHPHEAGEFIRRNLKNFPSELPPSLFDHLNHPKKITFIRIAYGERTGTLPAAMDSGEPDGERKGNSRGALQRGHAATCTSLTAGQRAPHQHHHGFLSQTPAYSFVKTLLELHIAGYNSRSGRYQFAEVISVLKHPYTQLLSGEAAPLEKELTEKNRFYPLPSELERDETLSLLFKPCSHNLEFVQAAGRYLEAGGAGCIASRQLPPAMPSTRLYREALFKSFTMVNRFHALLESKDLEVQPATFHRLLVRVMSTASIPFHGEPAIGMQVMGVLETRNLDFRHVILLSVNEGQLPKAGGDASFIPYNLRKAFGMTTIDHKIAVYAYYFYRLLQRAEKATLLYNTVSDGMNRGEMSRFMLQLLIEWGYPVQRKQLEAEQSPIASSPICIPKSPDIMKRMQSVFDVRVNPKALLSPSALNCYLDCPLKFYYKYVAGLAAPEEVSAEIDSAKFGSIFHYATEHIYKELTAHGKVISKDTLEALLQEEVKLQNYVDNGFKELFFHLPADERPEYNGVQAHQFRRDSALHSTTASQRPAPRSLYLRGLEQRVMEDVEIQTPKGAIRSRMGGIIDRMDSKDNVLRIVDYKTGGKADTPPSVESLFTPGPKRSNYVFQTFLYAAIVCRKLRERNDDRKVAPALLYIHRAAAEDYSPVVQLKESYNKTTPVEDFSLLEEEFRTRLQALLEEIFNPDLSFSQTEEEDRCTYCDFKEICKR